MSAEPKKTRSEQARINGRASKGPKSKEGKERSSQNAIKHGLTSKTFILMQDEVPEEFEAIRDSFIELYNPQNAGEACLVHLIAQMEWKCLRCGRLEDEAREALSSHWNEGLKRAITVDGFETRLQSYNRQLSNLRLNIRRAEQDLLRRQKSSAGILPVAQEETTKRTQDAKRGAGVPPAKETPHEPQSPRANEPQHQNTKRTREAADPSHPTPTASRLSSPEPQSPQANEPRHENTKRTREAADPSHPTPTASRLSSSEPQSPRANEPQHENAKRTQVNGSPEVNPAPSRLPIQQPAKAPWTPPTPPFPLWVPDEARTREYERKVKAQPDS